MRTGNRDTYYDFRKDTPDSGARFGYLAGSWVRTAAGQMIFSVLPSCRLV